MVVYTLDQRWEILRHYFENHGNVCENGVRILKEEKHRRLCMFVIFDKPKREKPKTVLLPENTVPVAENICKAHFVLGGYVNKQILPRFGPINSDKVVF